MVIRARADEGRTAGNFPEGPKFDSSYDRGSPTTFAPNQVPRDRERGTQTQTLE